jgi:two-component system sensor histidine kinase/response regulator
LKLVTRLAVLITLLLGLAGVVIGFAVNSLTTDFLEKLFQRDLQGRAEHRMDMVQELLKQQLSDLKLLASSRTICASETPETALRRHLIQLRNIKGRFLSISLYDSDRRHLTDSLGLAKGEQRENDQLWQRAWSRGESVQIQPVASHGIHHDLLVYAVAVRCEADSPQGMLIGRVPLPNLFHLLQEAVALHDGRAELLDHKGLVLYSSFDRKAILNTSINPLTRDPRKWVQAMAGDNRTLSQYGLNWRLWLSVPHDKVTELSGSLLRIILGVVIGVGMIGIILVIIAFSHLLRPLRILASHIDLLAQGNMDFNPIDTSDDEIGHIAQKLYETSFEMARTKAQAAQAHEQLEHVLWSSGDGWWDWDIPKGELYFDQRWVGMLGYEHAEISPNYQGWQSLLHPDDLQPTLDTLNSYFNGETDSYEADFRMRCKHGEWKWIRARGKVLERDAAAKPLRMAGTHSDISDRKRMEQDLVNKSMELSTIVDNSNVGIIFVKQRLIIWSNRRMNALCGYSAEEMQNQSTRLLYLTEDDYQRLGTQAYPLMTSGEVFISEQLMRHRDGHAIWMRISGKSVSRNQPELGSIWVFEDITQQKGLEFELIHARESAEAANQSKSDFLANMSHEIRTPMNGVIGMTGLLLDGELNSQQRTRALSIKRSAESLLVVINDILDFSKIEAGRMDLELLDFDLGQLVADIAIPMGVRAEEKGLELICPANIVLHQWFQGDPARIRQILVNLIGNAIKFTEKGEVVVRYEVVQQRAGRSLLRFSVSDSGIGVDPRHQTHLFDRFTQADSSTTRVFGGTGLGLAICKQLVQLMDGEIGVDSTIGKGSTFWFTLDLADADPLSPPPRSIDLHRERILVVDDNATNRMLLDEVLTYWQVDYALANGGASALEALHTASTQGTPFTIALLDMQMPEMNGLQLGTAIQQNPLTAHTRTVLLTSQGLKGDAGKIQAAGFSGYLSKPINQSELYNALLQVAGIQGETSRLITRYTAREQLRFDARILVAEDNLTNQEVARGMLTRLGVEVEIAENGEVALALLAEQHYDLVMMDCQMPIIDGYQATRLIRDPASRVLNPNIPIIAMTAHAMAGDHKRSLDAGMNDHISKPVDPSKLQQALTRWLPTHCQTATTGAAGDREKPVVPTTASPANKGEEVSVFDHDSLLARMGDDNALVVLVIHSFLDDIPLQLKTLQAACTAGDAEGAGAQAHKIKGAAANVGAMRLSRQAYVMEKAGKAGDLDALMADLPDLLDGFQQVKTTMENHIDR